MDREREIKREGGLEGTENEERRGRELERKEE